MSYHVGGQGDRKRREWRGINVRQDKTYARQIKSLVDGKEIASREDTKVWVGLAILGLLQVVVPQVNVGGDELASNLLPVGACVGCARHRLAIVFARRRPARLADPDGLALGNRLGLVEAVVKQLLGVLNRVAVGALPVWVPVEANPVDFVDNLNVGCVFKRVVSVDVADGDVCERGALNGSAHLRNVVNERIDSHAWVASIALGITVQVLAADRDTLDQVGELSAVGRNGRLQRGNLVGDGRGAARDPQTQQQAGVGRDGGWNSLDRGVCGIVLDCSFISTLVSR